MAEYKTFVQPCAVTGIAVQTDDYMPEGKWPVLINLRNYRYGQLMPRRGLTFITNATGARINGMARINNATDNVDAYFAMYGSQLLYSTSITTPSFSTFSGGENGYSGNAVSMITAKPIQSNRPYVYIGDSSKQRKVTYQGSPLALAESIGIKTPTSPPDVKYSESSTERPYWTPITQFNATTNWTTSSGGPAAINALTRLNTANRFVYRVNYDDASGPGWCNFTLKSAHPGTTQIEPNDIGPGMQLAIAGVADVFLVHKVTKGWAATTFAAIKYDPSSTLVSATLAAPVQFVEVDSLIMTTDSGAVNRLHRVLSVSYDRDGIPSIRFDALTAGLVAGNAVVGYSSVRGYHSSGTIADGNSVGSTGLTLDCNGESTASAWYNAAAAYDLSDFAAGKPIQDDDYFHISVKLVSPENVKEIKVMMSLEAITGVSDFNSNSYIAVFKASAIAAAIANEETLDDGKRTAGRGPLPNITDPDDLRPSRIGGRSLTPSNDEVFNPTFQRPDPGAPIFQPPRGPTVPISPTTSASNNYAELFVRVKELVRIGENKHLTLEDVQGFRIDVQHTGDCDVSITSANFQGGGNPDVVELASPYYYRYRYRNTTTGVRSSYSPPYRGGVRPRRCPITITGPCTSTAAGWLSSDADVVDIERWGGTVASWRFIGYTTNSHGGSDWTFYDNVSDYTANLNAPFSNEDVIQPWPIIGNRTTGTCTVAGTTVQASTGTFSTSWAQGTIIELGGWSYQIYRVISTSYLELYECAGTETSAVTWVVEEPIIESQPLPRWFGPYEGFCFAMGDTYHPGRLYHTVGNDPDSTRILNFIDITDDPSEELMNGCVYNGRAYLWTNKRMFQLIPSFHDINLFRVVEVPAGRGLFAYFAFAVGPALWWMSSDGIYESFGADARRISEELNLLFEPHGRQSGGTKYNYSTLSPIDINHRDTPTASAYRLAYYENELYFDYLGTDANYHTLVYDMTYSDGRMRGWFKDVYSNGAAEEVTQNYKTTFHWGDNASTFRQLFVGTTNNTNCELYYMGGATVISARATTPLFDGGDARGLKEWGDGSVEMVGPSSGSHTVTLTLYNDRGSSIGTSSVATGSTRDEYFVPVTGSGTNTAQHRAIALDISVATGGTDGGFSLFQYAFSFLDRPDTIIVRNTDFHDHGWPGNKLVRGIVVEASGTQALQLIKDDGTAGATVNIAHSGRRKIEYGITPFETVLLRLNPTTSANEWQLYGYELIFDKHAQVATTPTQWDDLGEPGAKFVQGMLLEASTLGSASTVRVEMDGAVQAVSPDLEITQSINDHVKPYSWEPFITHRVRLVPQGGDTIGIDRVTWIWEPEPEYTTHWETQDISFAPGYGHVKEVWMSVLAASGNQSFALELTVDGATTNYNPTGVLADGVRQKLRFLLAPTHKGRLFRFELTSASNFRLYAKDCEVHFKQWGTDGAHSILRPFGDEHVRVGARI